MIKKPIRSFTPVCFILFFLLASCSTIRPVPPEVNLLDIKVRDITLSHINMFADLRIYNPNQMAITIRGVDYVLYLNDVKVSTGNAFQPVTVEPGEENNLTLRLSSAYWDILQLIKKMQHKEEVHFVLKGSLQVSGFGILGHTFRFEKEGSIPLEQLSR